MSRRSPHRLGLRQQSALARRRAAGLVLQGRDLVATRTAGARRAAAPVTEVISSAAWVLAGAGLVALLLAWRLDWTELLVGGLFALLLLMLCVLFVLGSTRLEATLDLTRTRVVVGEQAHGRLLVRNASRHRMLPVMVELPVGRGAAVFDLPSLAAGAEHEELYAIPTQRRAILDLGPVKAVRADPLALLRRERELTEKDLLYVHPRTVRIVGSASGFIRDLEGTTVRKISDHDVAFHALREYVPGDDRRFIHWKSSARTGTLMVRQFEETRRSHLMVLLSTRLDDHRDAGEFELAVSTAGSLGAQNLRDGYTVSALTSTVLLRSDHPTVLLDQLAGVDFEPQAPRLSETMRRLGSQVQGASVAMIVCGSVMDAAELRRARRLLALDVRTIVVRCEPGAETSLQQMGELDLVTIGALEDLPSVLRRLAR